MTVIADLKDALDDVAGLSAVFRRGQDLNPAFPYATIIDPIADAPLVLGDGNVLATRYVAQVDLWQEERAFSQSLVDAAVLALDGLRGASAVRYRVADVAMVDEPEGDVIHHAITVTAPRLR